MDSNEINKIEENTKRLLANIKQLEESVRAYQDENIHLRKTADAIQKISGEYDNVANTIESAAKDLCKTDTVALLDEIKQSSETFLTLRKSTAKDLAELTNKLYGASNNLERNSANISEQSSAIKEELLSSSSKLDLVLRQIATLPEDAKKKYLDFEKIIAEDHKKSLEELAKSREVLIAKTQADNDAFVKLINEKIDATISAFQEKTEKELESFKTSVLKELKDNASQNAKATEELTKQTKALAEEIKQINATLNEGVKTKRRFF